MFATVAEVPSLACYFAVTGN